MNQYRHDFGLNFSIEFCTRCGVKCKPKLNFLDGAKRKIELIYEKFGCISDNEVIIKNLLE